MSRHTIRDEDGNIERGPGGGDKFYSDKDGDSKGHQTVYEKTEHGSKELPEHYDPGSGEFHKK
jgi:hypothetical protein